MGNKYELKLEGLKVVENGVYETSKKGLNFFEAILVYPDCKTPNLRTIMDFQLPDNKDFIKELTDSLEKFPKNLNEGQKKLLSECSQKEKKIVEDQLKAELSNMQILFKQEFETDSTLIINISAVEKVDKFERAVLGILGKISLAAINALTGVGSVVKAAFSGTSESIFGDQKEDSKKLTSIGKGIIKINSKSFNKAIKSNDGLIKIPLIVPNEVEIRPFHKFDSDGSLKYGAKKPKVLRMWKKNGEVILSVKHIENET